jgi:Family of unknown function (DUF6279)
MSFRFRPGTWPVALAAVFLTLLAGCSKLKLGYEYADWLVIYAVEDNFDLDKSQRGRFKEDVEAYFKWHRKALLPLYADLLSGAADSLGKGLGPEGIDTAYAHFRTLHRKTMLPTVDKAVDMLVSLKPDQIDNWLEKQKKKNLKLKKDFSGSPEDQLERRYEKTVDEMEDWTGRLSKDQRRQIRALSRTLPWNGHLWLENRENLQVRLATLLKSKPPRKDVRALMEDYFLHPEKLRSQEYNARIGESEARIKVMVTRVFHLLTPAQKRHLRSRMEKLAEDFRRMSRQV